MAATSVVAALATLTLATPAGAAEPVEASCGATLTTDAYLSRDLVCDEGLTVAANVTIDLRGHRLSGPSTEVPSVAPSAISIVGGSAVTIRNGRIDHWGKGVSTGPYPSDPEAETLPSLKVSAERVTFEHNTEGLAAGDFIDRQVAVSFDVTRSRFDRNWLGVSSENSGSVVVSESVFVNNVSAGIYAYGRSGLTVSDSRFSGGNRGIDCKSNCLVTRSRIERSRTGVSVTEGILTTEDSALSGNGTAVHVAYLASVNLTRTTVKANKTGVLVGQYIVFTASQSTFTGNEVAVRSRRVDATNPLAYNVTMTGNVLRRNEDGIFLRRDPDSTVQLQDNLAVDNTRYGIYAPGATDLGGNQSARNGRACVGVVCDAP